VADVPNNSDNFHHRRLFLIGGEKVSSWISRATDAFSPPPLPLPHTPRSYTGNVQNCRSHPCIPSPLFVYLYRICITTNILLGLVVYENVGAPGRTRGARMALKGAVILKRRRVPSTCLRAPYRVLRTQLPFPRRATPHIVSIRDRSSVQTIAVTTYDLNQSVALHFGCERYVPACVVYADENARPRSCTAPVRCMPARCMPSIIRGNAHEVHADEMQAHMCLSGTCR
jgi:hypothetical protein